MFDPEVIREIYKLNDIALTLAQLRELEKHLAAKFHDAALAARALVLAVASGESLLFIGPPGVAKSKLIGTMCELIGIKRPEEELGPGQSEGKRKDGGYFEYLLTRFTEPSELFGALKIEDFNKPVERLSRHETGMIHRSRVVFLDEVFNGSSAILNALLALMNERRFHDRGEIKKAWLHLLLGATNARPKEADLRAAYDRFVLRVHVDNIDPKPQPLRQMLERAWSLEDTEKVEGPFENILDHAKALRDQVRKNRQRLFSPSDRDPELENLHLVLAHIETSSDHRFSNRRIVKLTEAMVFARLLRMSDEGGGDGRMSPDEYKLAWQFFLDDPAKGQTLGWEIEKRLFARSGAG